MTFVQLQWMVAGNRSALPRGRRRRSATRRRDPIGLEERAGPPERRCSRSARHERLSCRRFRLFVQRESLAARHVGTGQGQQQRRTQSFRQVTCDMIIHSLRIDARTCHDTMLPSLFCLQDTQWTARNAETVSVFRLRSRRPTREKQKLFGSVLHLPVWIELPDRQHRRQPADGLASGQSGVVLLFRFRAVDRKTDRCKCLLFFLLSPIASCLQFNSIQFNEWIWILDVINLIKFNLINEFEFLM